MGWCSKCSKMVGTLWVLERSATIYEKLSIRFLSWCQIIKIAKSDFVNSLSFLRNLVLRSILNVSVICWFFLDSNCRLTQGDFCLCILKVVDFCCWCILEVGEFTLEWNGFPKLALLSTRVSANCATLQDSSLAIFSCCMAHFARCVSSCLLACFAFFVSLACFLFKFSSFVL